MGTIQEAGEHAGHIYLHNDVSGEFGKTLASTKHNTADTFLEHLLELFIQTEHQTQVVQVRSDLAQRFTALQCRTHFQTSDELMKHLLRLHAQQQKTLHVSVPKSSQGKSNPSPATAALVGRRGRKSQPKRNYVHAALIDSDDDSGGPSSQKVSSASRQKMGVSSADDTEVSNRELSDMETTFDLTKVKQEVTEEHDLVKAKQNDKDSRLESGPLCLSLHKPISARDAARMLHNDVIAADDTKQTILYRGQQLPVPENLKPSLKTARQFTQPNWRSHSEPVDHDLSSRPHRDPLSLQASPQDRLLESKVADVKREMENPQVEALRNGYNYVLNSLASSPGSDGPLGTSLPNSPMQVPVNYPKSTTYQVSSDEDEPEDLSFNTSSSHCEQPQNLSLYKSKVQQLVYNTVDDKNAIKYDSNANAVPIPLTQIQNGQLIAQTQIPVPQNLIFHDPRTVNAILGQPPLMQMAPKSLAQAASLGSIMQTSAGGQQTMLVSSQPPPLQLVNMRGPPPLMMRPTLVSPTSNPQILIPSNSVVSPNSLQAPLTPTASNSDDNLNQDSPGSKRRRKKMEDTTIFRDPPEQSLPFNGPNKYRFYCDVCDTGFTRRYTFNRHKCKGRVEKHYCQMCDKAYLSKYKLKDHILVKHEGQTVSCPECGKRFSSRSSMEMHKKQQHEGQYSIFCRICGKGFNHTGHYYGHMNKHTNTKPFWCQQCGKRFYGSSYLHNHKQVCRGNSDMNYSCTICERKFKCELYLKKHMKIHDNTPIIANPNVAKPTDEDLTNAGVKVADPTLSPNDDSFQMSQPIFPNGPDYSDSSSNSCALVIDDLQKAGKEGNNNLGNDDSLDMAVA